MRDMVRGIKGDAALEAVFGLSLMPARRAREQRKNQRGPKVYSLHAPEVECIGKGKAHRPYEFGAKVSLWRIVADRGYRGPPAHRFKVYLSGQKRGVSKAINTSAALPAFRPIRNHPMQGGDRCVGRCPHDPPGQISTSSGRQHRSLAILVAHGARSPGTASESAG
jgi:hypothetical protein